MKATELRLENNLLINDINEVCKITSISNKYIGYETKSRIGECLIECLTPIELSEEILLKCGWKWNVECDCFEGKDARMYLTYKHVNNSYEMFNYITKTLITKRIFYLHQLQNLYFALTNEELTVNP